MPEKNWAIIFIIISITCFSFGQEKRVLTEITGHYVLKERWVITQAYADNIETEESEFRTKNEK